MTFSPDHRFPLDAAFAPDLFWPCITCCRLFVWALWILDYLNRNWVSMLIATDPVRYNIPPTPMLFKECNPAPIKKHLIGTNSQRCLYGLHAFDENVDHSFEWWIFVYTIHKYLQNQQRLRSIKRLADPMRIVERDDSTLHGTLTTSMTTLSHDAGPLPNPHQLTQ